MYTFCAALRTHRKYAYTLRPGRAPTRQVGEVRRRHAKPRRELFTPMRVDGRPPAAALASTRRTTGTFLDTGEEFLVVDEWTARSTAHRDMGRWWTGETIFMVRQ